MSRLTDLIARARAKDAQLGADLEKEFRALSSRRAFGLNFERHRPEAVELPGRPVRKGDKVRILPPRGEAKRGDQRLWRVIGLERREGVATARLETVETDDGGIPETAEAPIAGLVVIAAFGDTIYPGLISTGKVERGGDAPFHTVINAENYHALKALTYTHRGKIDAIYIDPPYNSGATDWKYNNNYVERDDKYRHSKWLAMIERRLIVARELLNPQDSVLILTIDAREYLRIGLLLEQMFPEARIQMVSSVINPKGVSVKGGFRRADEYIFFCMFGGASPARLALGDEWSPSALVSSSQSDGGIVNGKAQSGTEQGPAWTSMMRRGSEAARSDRPSMYYPIYADPSGSRIVDVGEPVFSDDQIVDRDGLVTILPHRKDGSQGRWQISATELKDRIEQGRVRLGRKTAYGFVVNYLPDGAYAEIFSESFQVAGRADDGSIIAYRVDDDESRVAPTQWKIASHNASEHGSGMLEQLIPKKKFPFPKSLFAVEDTLRFFVNEKVDATILDFFAGSGTTAHAVMRLNRRDGGRRQCISVTNNEVAAEEQQTLRQKGLRPGDPEWEQWGICDYITKPRIRAAITGQTPEGAPIKGDYKFTDEFPMAEGFEANAEFFTLTYETPRAVDHSKSFGRIAPLLWMRAGSRGRRVDVLPESGWELAETYGLLTDLDEAEVFAEAATAVEGLKIAFIVTNDDRRFEAVCRLIPDGVEPVRLYESYLTNFAFESGGGEE